MQLVDDARPSSASLPVWLLAIQAGWLPCRTLAGKPAYSLYTLGCQVSNMLPCLGRISNTAHLLVSLARYEVQNLIVSRCDSRARVDNKLPPDSSASCYGIDCGHDCKSARADGQGTVSASPTSRSMSQSPSGWACRSCWKLRWRTRSPLKDEIEEDRRKVEARTPITLNVSPQLQKPPEV